MCSVLYWAILHVYIHACFTINNSWSDPQLVFLSAMTLAKVKFNVPLVEKMDYFDALVRNAIAVARELGSLRPFFQSLKASERERAERLFRTAYMAIYAPLPRPKFAVPNWSSHFQTFRLVLFSKRDPREVTLGSFHYHSSLSIIQWGFCLKQQWALPPFRNTIL